MLPDSKQWSTALEPFLNIAPNLSLAITNPLDGVVYMVDRQDADAHLQDALDIPRDFNGYSPALRMALYVSEMMEKADKDSFFTTEQHADAVLYLTLVSNLASDNLGLHGANHLWTEYTSEVDEQVSNFISSTQVLVSGWLDKATSPDLRSTTDAGFLGLAGKQLLEASRGKSPLAYHHARAFTVLQGELVERHDIDPDIMITESSLKNLRRGPDIFLTTGLLTAYKPYHQSLQLCNEIVSDLTGFDALRMGTEGRN